jgi:hypothetical protein
MDPDSNQQSNTSGTRLRGGIPSLADGIVISSTLHNNHPHYNYNSSKFDPPIPSHLQFPVQIFWRWLSAESFQFLPRPDADHFLPVLGCPDGNGGSPIATPRHCPVPSLLQPIPEPLLLHKLRHPVTLPTVTQQCFPVR